MSDLRKIKSSSFCKNKKFLSQLPYWENSYKTSDQIIINFTRKEFKIAKASYSKHTLKILGHVVMEDWETPYMEVLAKIATSKGGTVLEVGFGMGISSRFIQEANIEHHIIIEANHDVALKAYDFAKNSRYPVTILHGLWEEVINNIADDSIDGILFDTYPLSEIELYQNHFTFFKFAYRKLKNSGIFTYYSDEIKKFSKLHIEKLIESGFKRENIRSRIVRVNPPKHCEYWGANTILAPIIVK